MNATSFPWAFKKVPIWAPTKPTEDIPVFEFCFTGGEEWMRTARANAILASSSPELLEACETALKDPGISINTAEILAKAIRKATRI